VQLERLKMRFAGVSGSAELPATYVLEKADFAGLEHEITGRLLTTEIKT